MKTNRRVAWLFMPVLGSFVLLILVLSWVNAAKIVYGESLNGSLAVGLDLTPGDEKYAYPGAVVPYTHTLTNTGDNDIFTISVKSSQGWDVTVTPQTTPDPLELNNGEQRLITVTVSIPFGAAGNDEDKLVVTVESINDPSRMVIVTNTTTVRHHIFLPVVINPARWEKVGNNWPSSVTGRSLAVCAADPEIILAGTIDNGVQIFNGTSWTPAASVPTGKSVTGLVMNQACNYAYASLYDGGVWQGDYRSGSWDWTRLGNDDVLAARSLALAGDRLFVAGDFGIGYWHVNSSSSWQITSLGNQPVMYVSAAAPTDSNSALYAVQWQDGKIYRAAGNAPGTWNPLPLPDVPNVDMRSVFGDATGVQFVGTQSGSYRLNGNTWEALPDVPVGAGLRAGVVTGSAAYLGYTDNAGVYKVQGSTLTPLSVWETPTNKSPEIVYDLVLAEDGKLYAATTDGVFVYAQP